MKERYKIINYIKKVSSGTIRNKRKYQHIGSTSSTYTSIFFKMLSTYFENGKIWKFGPEKYYLSLLYKDHCFDITNNKVVVYDGVHEEILCENYYDAVEQFNFNITYDVKITIDDINFIKNFLRKRKEYHNKSILLIIESSWN